MADLVPDEFLQAIDTERVRSLSGAAFRTAAGGQQQNAVLQAIADQGEQGAISSPAITQQTTTDNSGGTPGTTIAAITNANNAGSADVTPTADAIASLAARLAEVEADNAAQKVAIDALRTTLQNAGLTG